MVKILISLACLCLSVQAATYYVSPSGSDSNPGTFGSPWKTYGYALSNAPASSTVQFLNGTYSQPRMSVHEANGVKSGTAAGSPTIFENYTGHSPVIAPLDDPPVTGEDLGYGIALTGHEAADVVKSNIVIRGLIFDLSDFTTAGLQNHGGVRIGKGVNITVSNCFFRNMPVGYGFLAAGQGKTDNSAVTNFVLSDCVFSNYNYMDIEKADQPHAIYLGGLRDSTVQNLTIINNATELARSQTGATGFGLHVYEAGDWSPYSGINNTFRNIYISTKGKPVAFASFDGQGLRVYNCVFKTSATSGVNVLTTYGLSGAAFDHNTFYGGSTGIDIATYGTFANNIFRNNIIWPNGSVSASLGYDGGETTYWTNNLLKTTWTGSGARVTSGNIIGSDPMFSDTNTLAIVDAGSPAHNAGIGVSWITTDFRGAARVSPDIGAWEIGETYYVAATGGSDSNPGTYSQPFATFKKLLEKATAGNTLVLKNGTYSSWHGGAVTATINVGSYTVTASGPFFTDYMLGSSVYFGDSGWSKTNTSDSTFGARITAVLSPTQVTVSHTPSTDQGNQSGRIVVQRDFYISGKSGTSGDPITIKAETDYQATVSGAGTDFSYLWPGGGNARVRGLFNAVNCNWLIVEGIRWTDSTGYCVWLDGTSHSIVRRCVGRRPNPYHNNHCFTADDSYTGNPSMFNLFEDNLCIEYHRHGTILYGSGSISNTVRRVYSNAYGWEALPPYYSENPDARDVNEGASSYGGWASTFENLVVMTNWGMGLAAHGNDRSGAYPRFFGCVVQDSQIGWNMNSRRSNAIVTNALLTNCVSFKATASAGANYLHLRNVIAKNCAFIGAANGAGIYAGVDDWWYTHPATADSWLSTQSWWGSVIDSVVMSNRHGYYMNDNGYNNSAAPSVPFTGTYTLSLTNNVFFANTSGDFKDPAANFVLNEVGRVNANPGYSTSKYGKGAFLLPAPNYPTRGATVLYRYQNGVLTTNALWPWPTDSQIVAEIGQSATWETNGGIWKTLDGLYGTPPPTDPPAQVSVAAESPFAYESPLQTARFRFDRSITTNSITAYYTIGGTAVAGDHYVAFSTQVTFGVGVATVYATVTPIAVDTARTVEVTLSADPLDPDTYVAVGGPATITIVPEVTTGAGFRPPPGNRPFTGGWP